MSTASYEFFRPGFDPRHFHFFAKTSNINLIQRTRLNNQITAPELRVIDQEGKNLGVLPTTEALRLAREAGLDLIEISPTAKPPVAKITDRGKFFYAEEKKRRQAAKKHKEVEIKSVRIGIGTSSHDLEIRAKQANEFLEEGNQIKIDLFLRGREKYLDKKFLEGRIERVLNLISRDFEKEDIKKGPRGLSLTLRPKK